MPPASSDAEVRAAIANLLAASGTPATLEERDKQMLRAGGSIDLYRPWHWLAAVAREASATGDHQLAGMAFLFTIHYMQLLVPKMSLADFMEVGLDPAPTEVRVLLVRAALAAVNALPSEFVIVGDHKGAITVDVLMRYAEWETVDLKKLGVSAVD